MCQSGLLTCRADPAAVLFPNAEFVKKVAAIFEAVFYV
jgi:hypothetical protein